jgi:hypothetical protein
MHHLFKSLTSSNLPEDQDTNKEVVIPTRGQVSLYDHLRNKSLIKSKISPSRKSIDYSLFHSPFSELFNPIFMDYL